MQGILTFKFIILDSLCFLKFQIHKDYIMSLILNMIIYYGGFINYYLYLLCVISYVHKQKS